MTSPEIREELVKALKLDLIGPEPGDRFEHELLPETPDIWYLAGFLAPAKAEPEQRMDPAAQEDLFATAESGGLDDDEPAEKPSGKPPLLPASMGISFFVPDGVEEIEVEVTWGDYRPEPLAEKNPEELEGAEGQLIAGSVPNRGFRRVPHRDVITVPLNATSGVIGPAKVPNSGGLEIAGQIRPIADPDLRAEFHDACSVALFLINRRPARRNTREHFKYEGYAFQARLAVTCLQGFVGAYDLRRRSSPEWEDAVADLHFRDLKEFGVGHGVSVKAFAEAGACTRIETTWTPAGEVERVVPAPVKGVELRMEALGAIEGPEAAVMALSPFVAQYREWIERQGKDAAMSVTGSRLKTSEGLLALAESAAHRIADGIESLHDPDVFEAFRIANRSIAAASRRRKWQTEGGKGSPKDTTAPEWRPFQLAFILMNLPGLVDPSREDRETVDLLFFPTGGGKTEAYLGLAAFAMVYRRLKNPKEMGCGMSVLMRYTLRLLTLDQLGRAAGLICALELEREENPRLGTWPFEIGLWVGRAATPNRLGKKGDNDPYCAYRKLYRFRNDPKNEPAPIPIEECPWCGAKFAPDSFLMVPNERNPIDLRVHCVNPDCDFNGGLRSLPILGVDEPIYRRLPAFLIATVDKFAALPWTGMTGKLFGHVTSSDGFGFYGPCDPAAGNPLDSLPSPDLIIQDELHLISGPLGTIAALYEAAIDALTARDRSGQSVRPKVIASTATIRRADTQIRALFARPRTAVFPPPGPDRRDSFFAITKAADEEPPRLYLGLAAHGRSPKLLLLRSAQILLSAGRALYEREGKQRSNSADPYMTLLAYFNSLRELGGARRIIEGEVQSRLETFSQRKRLEPEDRMFADRQIAYDVLELTSRESTDKVAQAKQRLGLPYSSAKRVDVAIATNMISVGLDILRLGLMVVFGQPKTTAEYIQATSRVGRDVERPGLVVTLLNVNRPRDRSHYERFAAYHSAFYREVEATSVTPFAPRALDRAFPAALIALCRHMNPAMTAPDGALRIRAERQSLEAIAAQFEDRSRAYRDGRSSEVERLARSVRARGLSLLDAWFRLANEAYKSGGGLSYNEKEEGSRPAYLLHDLLEPNLVDPLQRRFRAGRSMREVEPSVQLKILNLPLRGTNQ